MSHIKIVSVNRSKMSADSHENKNKRKRRSLIVTNPDLRNEKKDERDNMFPQVQAKIAQSREELNRLITEI